jgi:hypothetical protein
LERSFPARVLTQEYFFGQFVYLSAVKFGLLADKALGDRIWGTIERHGLGDEIGGKSSLSGDTFRHVSVIDSVRHWYSLRTIRCVPDCVRPVSVAAKVPVGFAEQIGYDFGVAFIPRLPKHLNA